MAGRYCSLRLLSVRGYDRVSPNRVASSSSFSSPATVHRICRLTRQVHVVPIVHLELLAIHGLFRMRQFELGRSLEACRGQFLSEGRLGEVGVRRKRTVQAVR